MDNDECAESNGGCDQVCSNLPGGHECSCLPGYHLTGDYTCDDTDECLIDNGGCSQAQLCVNTPGSRLCHCRPGWMVDTKNTDTGCVDVNECDQSNGGCDQRCHNKEGGHTCSCNNGFHLLSDMQKCADINECDTENGRCSHICKNTEGGHECSCPAGMTLEDGGYKCKQEERFCPALKRPKYGYFKCTSRRRQAGYVMGSKCRLRCRKGYKAVAGVRKKCFPDSSWTGGQSECCPVACPVISAPLHGKVTPKSCSTGTNKIMAKCSFECNLGFIQSGSKYASCNDKEEWEYLDGPTQCKANFPPPFIICPPDQTKPLPHGSTSVYVMFSQPKTNVDWFRWEKLYIMLTCLSSHSFQVRVSRARMGKATGGGDDAGEAQPDILGQQPSQ